jgi:DNA-binding IclR family transcriptional regulator
VTAAVRRLSQAINDDDVLTAVALDPIYRLAAEIKWPLTLATPSGTSMLMRITTEHEGPFGLARIPPGALAPMQDTTTGLLYLSLVDSRTRARILSALRAVEPEAARRQDQPGVDSLLKFAVRHRYLIIERPWLREGNLGVAILDGVHPIGGLAMRYIKSALMHDELIDRFLPRLHQLSAEITARYQYYKSYASLDFDRAPVECAAL